MNKFISPILNLIVTGNANKYHIFDPTLIHKEFINDNFIKSVGTIEVGRLLNNPIWFFDDNNSSNMGGNLHTLSAVQNNVLATGFWLIKDCSCMSPVAILFNDLDAQKDIRNKFISNSKGNYQPTEFNVSEIEDAFIKHHQLHGIIGNRENEAPNVQAGAIKSPYASIPYNSFENIERALNFIHLARSTSSIPEKVSWYVVAIEALFGNDDPGEVTYKVCFRTALFFDLTLEEKVLINDKVKLAYGLRSKFLHGAKLDKKHKFENEQIAISTFLDTILRQIFNLIITDEGKRKIFLDKKLFDDFYKQRMFGN